MEEKKELSIIERFIKDRMYHYALLLDGEWGSGKTYFVREELIPHLEEQGDDVNYISLYGVEKASVVGEMMCIQAIKSKNPKLEKLLNSKPGQITTIALSAALKTGL